MLLTVITQSASGFSKCCFDTFNNEYSLSCSTRIKTDISFILDRFNGVYRMLKSLLLSHFCDDFVCRPVNVLSHLTFEITLKTKTITSTATPMCLVTHTPILG